MNKIEFLAAVSAKLDGLAPADVREQIGFLSEMIDDRMEEGITEAAAVAAVGAPAEVAARILADLPFATEVFLWYLVIKLKCILLNSGLNSVYLIYTQRCIEHILSNDHLSKYLPRNFSLLKEQFTPFH